MIGTNLKYKLVAFDLDGTLVGRDLTLSQRVIDAVRRMREAGVAGCIVTGRMYRAAVTYARQLGFDAPIVCYQGAAVIDPSTDSILRDIPVPNDVVRSVIDTVERDRLHLQLYRNDEYYCEERNRFSDMYARIAGVQPIVVTSLRETFGYSQATKAIVISDPLVAEEYERTLRGAFGERAYVTRSLPEFVEVMNPAVDKGDALKFVASHLGISTEEIVAIGDSWNDAPLLRAAGFAVAMGSAPQELRDVANAVVADVTADGVAEAIERYVLA
jgi:Cof subfamily protein (haloacid dehalogenase superfamily)